MMGVAMGNDFERHLSIEGAMQMFQKSRLMGRVAEKVRRLDRDKAYRVGIGPLEYDAIVAARLSAVETSRLKVIDEKLTDPSR